MPWINELWSSALATSAILAKRGVRRHLNGQWGDQMLYEQAYLVDLWNRLQWLSLLRDMREIPRWEEGSALPVSRSFARQLVHWDLPRPLVPLLRSVDRRFVGPRQDRPWYGERLRSHGTAPPPRKITVGLSRVAVHPRNVYAKLRSKYYLLAHEWDDKVSGSLGFESSAPLLDRDLVAFVMAIPGEMTNHRGRQRSILRDAMTGLLPDEVRLRRSKADFTDMTNRSLMVELEALGVGGLRGGLSDRLGYVIPEELESHLAQSPQSSSAFMDFASHLTALEAWLQTFFAKSGAVFAQS
jgi:hypothetical protein